MGLLDVLLPTRCVVCSESGPELCPACLRRLPRLSPPLCARCGTPTAWPVVRCRECAGRRLAFASARAAVVYDDAVGRFVRSWKEHGLRTLAVLAAELVAFQVERPQVAVVTFVPGDRERSRDRGHHPAERLAHALTERWSLPVEPLLCRVRDVPRQRGLSLPDRRRNVAGAFVPRARAPASVALIDDVYTSGSTASAAATALRKAGARRVEVVTFARAVR